MAGWIVRQFKGIAPRAEPRLLQDNQAQVAVNCKLWHGSLRPLMGNTIVPDALAKEGIIQTIYRFGKDNPNDAAYWFHWTDDVDCCSGQIFDDTTERTYFTDGESEPKITDNSIALTGGTAYPENAYILGVPAPESECTANATGTGSGIKETRVYTYTYVSAWGEEGRPAGPSTAVDVLPGQSVELTQIDTAPAGNYNIATKRIYRTVTSGSDTSYYFVAEIPVATASYTDSILAENLGETLSSNTYHVPPEGMAGLCNMANGMMAGFKGKEVFLCEPFKPYAWPIGYRNTFEYDVVGIGALDTTLVVLTKGVPYLLQGSDPSVMVQVRINEFQACVSKRSIRVLMNSVVYASPDGLFAISPNGPPANLTEVIFTNKEWREFKPESISAYVFDNKYIAFYDTGTVQGGFILDPSRGDFTMLNWHATAGYYDPQLDALFLVVDGELVKFDSSSTPLSASWRSKVFVSPRPISIGAVQVEAAGFPVTLRIYADGLLKDTLTVGDRNPVRPSSGYKAVAWEFEAVSSKEVFSVAIAQTMADLRNV